jgi:hypothetical protein
MMEFVNWKDDIPYMKWKIKHVPNHQPVMILMTHISNIWIGYDRIILMGCPQEKNMNQHQPLFERPSMSLSRRTFQFKAGETLEEMLTVSLD